jgi:type IV secretion system protein VirB4
MLPFLKKKQDDHAGVPELTGAAAREISDYIPYYSHYNAHTLLTKNGEVMQTIRIRCNNQGLNYESGKSEDDTVREHIRTAIGESLNTDEYAVWVHTIRRRKKLTFTTKVSDPFVNYVNTEWRNAHHWKFQYYNEIFVSILHSGQGGELLNKKMMARAMSQKIHRDFRNGFLDLAAEKLEAATNNILAHIHTHYQAERLAIVPRNLHGQTVYYSEPMEFLGKILNFRTEVFPVSEADISKALNTHTLTFGFNAMEAKSADGYRRFGALLSLKQYREVPPAAADRLLQSPVECIISQSFNFTPSKPALKDYRIQKDIFQVSGDTYSLHASGLDDILRTDRGKPTDFGNIQTTIMVLTDEYKAIDEEINNVQRAFGEMGLISVREDIKLEECFWAQLPGNFDFIRRKDIIATPHIAGFARLNLFPDGKDSGNHWGSAVALIPTYVNSPYFFNFHQHDNGHTVLFDFNAFHDTAGHILAHFLVTSAVKYNGRLFVFDRRRSATLLFDKLNGAYHRLPMGTRKKSTAGLRLNPFSLADDKRNRGFLLAWCAMLIEITQPVTDAERTLIESTIDQLYTLPLEQRNLSAFVAALAKADAKLAAPLEAFCGNGIYATVFDNGAELLDLAQPLHAFDMDEIKKYPVGILAVFAYLMHRIILSLDGKPTIILLHEAFDLLDNPFFAPRLESLMQMLTQNNAMLFCTTQKPEAALQKSTFKPLTEGAATQLYLPDDIVSDYSESLPTLSKHDNEFLVKMDRQKGDFLVKQGNESIALCANFDELEAVKAILAGDIKTLIAAGGPFATLPKTSYDENAA